MRLPEFIRSNTDRIIADWEVFARSCQPAATGMNLDQLRDHASEMLKAVAEDLETPQTKQEQAEKSKGLADAPVNTPTAGRSHGAERAAIGYTPEQMIAEFRALRASVLRLWAEAQSEFNRANLDELTRFNEAVDQLLAESIAQYAVDVDRSKDLFLGVLGHDLRNPLGAIMTSAALMLRKEGPEWPHRRTASAILNSGTRMDEMTSDLVDFTRTRLGSGIPVVPEPMDLDTVCRNTVEEIAAFHPDATIHFESSGALPGNWDAGRVGQAVSNLIGNAYQHGAPSEPIEVSLVEEGEDVVIRVANKGRVIPPDRLRDIFSPFKQLDDHRSARDARSLGLGLYIVQSIVTAHHGTIEVESTASGTSFTVRLPHDAAA